MYGLQLVFVLVLIGGVIAYFGDRIGMKVGRKRLTLWGLRPKHTSIIVTIVTGVLIAASTIGVMSLVSQDARDALFRLEDIKTALSTSMTQLKDLEDEAGKAIQARDEALAEKEKLEDDIEILKTRTQTLLEEVKRLETQRADLQRSVDVFEGWILTGDVQGSFAFHRDEIILSTVLEAGRSEEAITEELFAFLEQADRIALERGALDQSQVEMTALQFSDPQEFFKLTSYLADQEGKWIIFLTSEYNTLKGLPVSVYFDVYADGQVFDAGEVIVEQRVDNRKTAEQQVGEVLLAVKQRVRAAGVVADEQGHDVSLSHASDFFNAVAQLKSLKDRAAVIQAIVVQDTRRSQGPVELSLQVVER